MRIFFPLNTGNVLLGAYIPPGPRNQAAVRAIWMTSADDGSLASVQSKRIVRVNLPPGSSDTDRMTLALLLLVRVLKKITDPASLLADPMREFPADGDDARKYLAWELFRQPNMQLYLLPPSENLQAVTMVYSNLSDASTTATEEGGGAAGLRSSPR